jgi:hypothetical protein
MEEENKRIVGQRTNQGVFAEKVVGDGLVTTEELARGRAVRFEGVACQVRRGARKCAGRALRGLWVLDSDGDECCK